MNKKLNIDGSFDKTKSCDWKPELDWNVLIEEHMKRQLRPLENDVKALRLDIEKKLDTVIKLLYKEYTRNWVHIRFLWLFQGVSFMIIVYILLQLTRL